MLIRNCPPCKLVKMTTFGAASDENCVKIYLFQYRLGPYCTNSNYDGINSSMPSDAYMRQYNILTLVQIMACRLFGAKPLSEPMLPCCQLDHEDHISVKFYSNSKVLIHENAVENVVCKMAAIVSRSQCVNRIEELFFFNFDCSFIFIFSWRQMFLQNNICSGVVIDVNFKMSNNFVNEQLLMAKKVSSPPASGNINVSVRSRFVWDSLYPCISVKMTS